MIWGYICWNGPGTLTIVNGNINAENYKEIIDNGLWPAVAQYFYRMTLSRRQCTSIHRERSVFNYKTKNNIRKMMCLPNHRIITLLKTAGYC